MRPTGAGRALLAVVLGVLLACQPGPAPAPRGGTATAPGPTPTRSALDALESGPAAAARIDAEELLAAGARLSRGRWRTLVDPEWRDGVERPVYVGDARLEGGRLEADLVVATRLEDDTDRLVLRFLPAATVLHDLAGPTVAATVDGTEVPVTIDVGAARLVVSLPGRGRAGQALRLRLEVAYDVPPLEEIADDGSPAGLGLLARGDGTVVMAHWLPLLTLPGEEGPMVAWGDVGGFPAAVWSVRVRTGGLAVTGGDEAPCPGPCVWARGVGLRDLAVVVLSEPSTARGTAAGHDLRAVAPADLGGSRAVLEEVAGATRAFTRRFGPLAWEQVDTVAVPLRPGASGMEMPGLSLIDTDVWHDLRGGLGSFVVAHEVAHQWFHALVGSGSLSSPVVDESLAQYLSVLAYRDVFGEQAARDLAERSLRGRWEAALASGLEPGPPARPADAFPGARPYGALVYGRGAVAWLVAEERLGAEPVRRFLAEVVERHGLGGISDHDLVEEARAFDPELGRILETWWFDPSPALRSSVP